VAVLMVIVQVILVSAEVVGERPTEVVGDAAPGQHNRKTKLGRAVRSQQYERTGLFRALCRKATMKKPLKTDGNV
jgi:hypothetical protein